MWYSNVDVLHIPWNTDFIFGNDSEEGRYMETVAGDEGCWSGGLDLYIRSKSMWKRNEVYVGGKNVSAVKTWNLRALAFVSYLKATLLIYVR